MWSFLVTSVDVVILLTIATLGLGIFVAQDQVAFIGLILSIATAHFTTIRPFLRKPRLKLVVDEIRCSAPTLQGDTASWFIRLGIMNYGLTMAKSCVGRAIGIWTEQGERLKKFDPLTLYWSRQDSSHTGFSPVDIQGYGDIEYLDIAQVKKHDSTPLTLRIVLVPPMTLSKGEDDTPSPVVEPSLQAGIYYVQVAIYAEEVGIRPTWFEITCSENVPGCGEPSPCHIKEKKPKFAK